jgi:hypothetical protein
MKSAQSKFENGLMREDFVGIHTVHQSKLGTLQPYLQKECCASDDG